MNSGRIQKAKDDLNQWVEMHDGMVPSEDLEAFEKEVEERQWFIEQAEQAEILKSALEDIAFHVATPIGEIEDYKKTVYEFIDIAKRALGY